MEVVLDLSNLFPCSSQATRILTDRWWTWILEHPQLGPDMIHPTRSMFSPSLSPCVCVDFQL